MKAYPVEYRRRVVELHGQGWTTREIQDALGVSRAWVDSIKRLAAAGKPLDVKSRANKRTSLATRQGDRITARVADHPGTTLADLKKDLGLTESVWSIWRAVRALGLVRVLAGRVALAGVEARHPHMAEGEARTAGKRRVGLAERLHVLAREELVAHRAVQAVLV